jgi:hypothetical protein
MSDTGWAERRKLAQAIAALVADTDNKLGERPDLELQAELLSDLMTRLTLIAGQVAPEVFSLFPQLEHWRAQPLLHSLKGEDDAVRRG